MDNQTKVPKPIKRQALSKQLHNMRQSSLKRYKQKAAGDLNSLELLCYELTNIFLVNLGGGIGYVLRKIFYRSLFRQIGTGVIIGRGVVVRHPGRISVGHQVAIDDNVMLDAGGAGDKGLSIGDQVIISRNCIIQGKTGPVVIEDKVDIGANTLISSASGIYLESSVLIAGNCYIGGGRYFTESQNIPIMDQGWYSKGSIHIGSGSWLGAGVIVPDGIFIGKGCIVGAGSVVTKDLPDNVIAAGVPAKVLKGRDHISDGKNMRH